MNLLLTLIAFSPWVRADVVVLSDTNFHEGLVCEKVIPLQIPCHVSSASVLHEATCTLFYNGALYDCHVIFNTYSPPVGSVLEGWKLNEVPWFLDLIYIFDIGVRGSPYRYPIHSIQTIKGASK